MFLRRIAYLTAACLLLISGVTEAQTVAVAQISGVVADESGGALPGVEVTATHVPTGTSRFAITGSGGEYLLPNLPVGPYRLDARLQGFSAFEQTGITLAVGASPVINVALKIGSVTETVTVQADATMVEVRSTAVGTVVTLDEIVGLPLNGRQSNQLVLLAGGAVANGASGALIGSQRQYPSAVAIGVAGGTANSTLYLVDGGFNNDPLNNIGGPMPFPDALQEFKVESGVRPARYGMYTGATVNAVTRSGTNTYHGTGFLFGRHHMFNERGYFDVANDGLKRAQSGGTIGGPIIPGKLFFFAGPQFTNERIRPTTTDTFLPTARMLAGDFSEVMSAQCRGGQNRTLGAPFVNNRIDPALFSPIARQIVSLLPTSSEACGRYSFTVPNNSDEVQFVGRVDYEMTKNQRLFARYYLANYDRKPGYDGANLLLATGNGLGLDNRVQTLAFGHDQVYTPNLVGATRLSWQRSRILRIQGDQLPTWAQLGVNVYQYTKEPGQHFYNLNVTNGWGGPAFPGKFVSTTPQIAQDFDWIRNAHSFSFGAMWVRPFLNADGPFQANGNLQFNGQRTTGATVQDRNGIADFLLGLPSQFSQGGSQIVAEKMHYVGAYVQDVWRMNSHVTVNGGLRWEPYLAAKDQNGFTMAFLMDRFVNNQKSRVYPNAPAGLVFAGDEGFPDNGANTFNRLAQFAPRLGLVWDPDANNIQTIRAAWGLYYDSPKLWQYGHHVLNAPFGNTVTIPNPASLANPFAGFPGGNPLPVPDPIPSTVAFPSFGTYVTMPVDIKPMDTSQWNVSYQRQFATNWMASATYLGNRTRHIWSGHEMNPAVFIPGQSTTGNINQRRLFNQINPTSGPLIGSMETTDYGDGKYHGLLMSLQKRMSNGWSVNANYTVSRCRNNAEPGTDINNNYPDPFDPSTNWGPCDADRPQIVNSSVILQSRGVGDGFVRALTNEWLLGTIFQARSGAPLTPGLTGDIALTGLNNQRPVVVGDPDLEDRTFDRWFDTAAFASNTPGSWGNTPRGFLRGPAYWNVDMALSRRLPAGGGTLVEVRVEAFNVFNRVQPGNPNVTLGNANFGRITTTEPPRIIQFAAKYSF